MCLLIHQPKGVTFSRQELRDFYQHNPDGFGVAFGDGRTLHVLRLVGSEKEIIEAYQRQAAGRECVIHFRMATHGAKNVDNAHPYAVTDDIVMAHNGVLSCGNPAQPSMSDTWHLIQYVIRPIAEMSPDLLFCPTWGQMFGNLIGSSNKLAFIHRDGRVALVNKASGTTHKGAWLSNTYAWSSPDQEYGRWYSTTRISPRGAKIEPVEIEAYEDMIYDDGEQITEELLTAYVNNAENGIAEYVRNHPERAAFALSLYYENTDEISALEWIEDHNAEAVTALADAISDEAPAYFYH